ncbi:hypothetical protein L2E82_18565 [Cichorium intybus]|uniref:Uncharacterized protein n=1 Tax=Cichorium intybus TaxID=13427 RepID=A0ACB9FB60_CICIN|nr:hypothetical protein L2E82_18565 [Cichorium intybus]
MISSTTILLLIPSFTIANNHHIPPSPSPRFHVSHHTHFHRDVPSSLSAISRLVASASSHLIPDIGFLRTDVGLHIPPSTSTLPSTFCLCSLPSVT